MSRSFCVLSILTLLCLVPGADLLHARQQPPADKKEEALKRLDKLAKELDDLEQQISEERIKTRKDIVDKEQRQQTLDRAVTAQAQQLATERLKLEKQLRDLEAVTVSATEPNRIVAALRKKIDDLRVEQDRLGALGSETREELMVAEEKFRYLERKHDNQRRFLNLKIELAEQELFGSRDPLDRRKLDKIEQSLDTLRRDLAELQRKLDGKADTKPVPPK